MAPFDVRQEVVPQSRSMKLSRFDSLTSLFLSVIVLLGTMVLIMLLLWVLTQSVAYQKPPIEQSVPGTTPVGLTVEFEPPSPEEIETLMEPSLAETLDAISNVTGIVAGTQDSTSNGPKRSDGMRSDQRSASLPGVGNEDVIPRWERWQITFNARDMKDYASQLDHFGIELAAFGGGTNSIESAFNLASQPTRRINRDPSSEKRLYFSWQRSNPLFQFDRSLLNRAGVATTGRNVIRFIPAELEDDLARLEEDYCVARGKIFPASVAKTVFESRPKGSGFEFVVLGQRYR